MLTLLQQFLLKFQKKAIIFLTISSFPVSILFAQITVSADGPGETYEIFSNTWGGNTIEVPDCGHDDFGRHITEAFDEELNQYVFIFHIHTEHDDDRCINFDRQRNEVKTLGSSKPAVKAVLGETVIYRWKFKLDEGFQPSHSFTHVHQIKHGDGDAGMPVITITPRLANPERLEVLHNNGTGGTTVQLAAAPLDHFKGTWVEVYQRIFFDENGTYELVIKRISDGTTLLAYSNNNIDMWRDNATFARPKWGIYRSLNNKQQLRDEQVRFNDFYIAEDTSTDPIEDNGNNEDGAITKILHPDQKESGLTVKVYPSPTTGLLTVKLTHKESKNYTFLLHNGLGQTVASGTLHGNDKKNTIYFDIKDKVNGLYYLSITDDTSTVIKKI